MASLGELQNREKKPKQGIFISKKIRWLAGLNPSNKNDLEIRKEMRKRIIGVYLISNKVSIVAKQDLPMKTQKILSGKVETKDIFPTVECPERRKGN